MLLKLYYIFVQVTFHFLPLSSCLLTVPVSSIFRCRRFTVIVKEIASYRTSFSCRNVFINILSSFDNILQIARVLFSVNIIGRYIDVIIKMSVRNLNEGLNFRL